MRTAKPIDFGAFRSCVEPLFYIILTLYFKKDELWGDHCL